MTRELLDQIEAELKEIKDRKEKVAKERDELTKELKTLKYLIKNPKFGISKFKERDEDIECYTCLPLWDALFLRI